MEKKNWRIYNSSNLFQKNDYSIADKTKATEQIAVTVIPPTAVKADKKPEKPVKLSQ
jgi:hypothetical protein